MPSTHTVLAWDTGSEIEIKFPGDPKLYYVDFETGAYWIEGREQGVASRKDPSHFSRRSAGRWFFTHQDPVFEDWDELSTSDSETLENSFLEWAQPQAKAKASRPVLSWDVEPTLKQIQVRDDAYHFDFARMVYWVDVPDSKRISEGFIETSPEHPARLRRDRYGAWYYTFSDPPTRNSWNKWGGDGAVEIETLYQEWLRGE